MGDIVSISKYKLQKQKRISNLSEEQLANKILDDLNYNNKNIAIPIVKVAKNYGLGVFREEFKTDVAGKLFVNGSTENLYNHNEVILVNSSDYKFFQRVVIARMLGSYLIDIANDKRYSDKNIFLSEIIKYGELYDKYEEFILNILAPSGIFINQYNIAVQENLSKIGVYAYLSSFLK